MLFDSAHAITLEFHVRIMCSHTLFGMMMHYTYSQLHKAFTVKFAFFSDVPTETTPFAAPANKASDRSFYHVSARYRRDVVDLEDKFGNMHACLTNMENYMYQ